MIEGMEYICITLLSQCQGFKALSCCECNRKKTVPQVTNNIINFFVERKKAFCLKKKEYHIWTPFLN